MTDYTLGISSLTGQVVGNFNFAQGESITPAVRVLGVIQEAAAPPPTCVISHIHRSDMHAFSLTMPYLMHIDLTACNPRTSQDVILVRTYVVFFETA